MNAKVQQPALVHGKASPRESLSNGKPIGHVCGRPFSFVDDLQCTSRPDFKSLNDFRALQFAFPGNAFVPWDVGQHVLVTHAFEQVDQTVAWVGNTFETNAWQTGDLRGAPAVPFSQREAPRSFVAIRLLDPGPPVGHEKCVRFEVQPAEDGK